MAIKDMSTNIRTKLQKSNIKPFKYAKGVGRLFLESGNDFLKNSLPSLYSYEETNREIIQATAKFFRNPTDTTNKTINRAMDTEDFKALQKLANYALDDLKSGDLYVKGRMRDGEYGDSDDLLNDFGGFDMNFDESGEWVENTPDPSIETQKEIAVKQDEKDDIRTDAIIKTLSTTTDAIVNTENANAQANIRLSMKQHSQMITAAQNVILSQNAIFTELTNSVNGIMSVAREAHNQTITELQSVNTTLKEIKELVTPKKKEPDRYYEEKNKPFNIHGAVDFKKYAKSVVGNIKEEFNLDMINMGFSPAMLAGLVEDNPLQLITDSILNLVVPKSLKKQLGRTNKSISGFAPALIQKMYDKGKNAYNMDSSTTDLVAKIFGLKAPRSDNYIRFNAKDLGSQATITNRTISAIENVIPMWLSRIDHHIAGGPAMVYNYERNKLEHASSVIAENEHRAVDLVGNMRDTGWNIMNKADKYKFKTLKDKDDFNTYMYQFLQKMATDNNFINPYVEPEKFKQSMPETDNKDFYYKLISNIFKNIPKDQLIGASQDIRNARTERDERTFRLNNELRENGLLSAWSILDEGLTEKIKGTAGSRQFGANKEDLNKIVKNYRGNIEKQGSTARGTREVLSDIASMLRKGIITYTYIVGNGADNMDSSIRSRFNTVNSVSMTEQERHNDRIKEEYIKENNKTDYDTYKEIVNNTINKPNRPVREYYIDENTSDVMLDRIMGDIVEYTTGEKKKREKNADPVIEAELRRKEMADERRKDMVGKISTFITGKTNANSKVSKIQDALNKPFSWAQLGLESVDNFIFRILYGNEVADKIESGHGDEISVTRSVTDMVKAQFESTRDWFSDQIGSPLRKYLFDKETGIFNKIEQKLKDIFTPVKTKINDKINEAKVNAFGSIDSVSGKYTGGKFSDTINKFNDDKNVVGNRISRAFDRLLYGDSFNEERKGVKYDYAYKYNEKDGTGEKYVKNTKYSGIIGRFRQGFDSLQNYLLGGNKFKNTDSRKTFNMVKDEVSKTSPDMMLGGLAGAGITTGLGLLTGLWLPGGPIFGGILGSGLGFMKSSEKFKNYIFGDKIDVNDKDGNKIGETRKGSFISKDVYEGIKKYVPNVSKGALAGAALGGVGLLPFGIGPIVGGLFGSMGGMVTASDEIKKMIFGDAEDPKSGLISKEYRDKVKGQIKKYAPSVIGGAALGATAFNAVSSLGIIPGLALIPGGPIFGALGAITAGYNADSIHKLLFGEEVEEEIEEKDADGKPTGKKIKRKKRDGGVFNKAFEGVKSKLVEPFAKKIDSVGKNINKWFKDDVIEPMKNSMQPLKEQLTKAKGKIKSSLKNIGETITNKITGGINQSFENNVGKPMGSFFKEKIIKPMEKFTNKIFNAIGKIIGSIISAPFKALEYIVTGGRNKDDDLDRDDKKKNKRKAKHNQWREKNEERWRNRNRKRQDARFARATRRAANAGSYFQTVGERFASWKTEYEENRAERLREREYSKRDNEEEYEEHTGFFSGLKQKVASRKERKNKEKEERNNRRNVIRNDIIEKKNKKQEKINQAREERDKRRVEEKERKEKERTTREEKRGATGRNKTNNDYLKSISKSVKNIYNEIKDQVSGVGWNTAYIKTLLEKQFNTNLSDDELPDNMEGSKGKHIRKRRGILGKAKDKITDKLWDIRDFFSDRTSKVRGGAKNVWNKITYPFYLLSQGASMAGSALSTFAHGALEIVKAAGPILKSALQGFAELFKGAASVISSSVTALAGVMKDSILGISSLIRGTVEFIADSIPSMGHYLMRGIRGIGRGALSVAGGLWKGIKFVGSGIGRGVGKAARKITHKKTTKESIVKNIGTFRIAGGYLDKFTEDVAIKIGPKTDRIAFPWVNVIKGTAAARISNHAIPVYILGADTNATVGIRDINSILNTNTSGSGSKKKPSSSTNANNNDKTNADTKSNKDGDLKTRAKKKFSAWKRAYFSTDSRAEQNPDNVANVYDSAIRNAPDMDTVEAIKDSAQLNGVLSITASQRSSSKKDKDEGGGFLETILDLLGLAGGKGGKLANIAKLLGGKLGVSKLGKMFTGAKGSMLSGLSGLGVSGVASVIGTANAISNNDYGHAASYQARATSGILGKSAEGLEKSGLLSRIRTKGMQMQNNSRAKQTAKSLGLSFDAADTTQNVNSLKNKVTSKISDMARKVMDSSIVKKLIPEKFRKGVAGALHAFKSKLGTTMATCTADTVKGFAKKLNFVVTIATSVYDFVSGFNEAANILNISASNVTIGMRIAAATAKTLSGLAFGLIPVSWLSTTVYKLFANEDKEQELEKAQTEFKQQAVNAGMSVEEYNKKENKTFFQKTKDFFKGIGDWISGNKGKNNQQSDSHENRVLSGKGPGETRFGTGMKRFSQSDNKWNKSDRSISKVGCGPTVAAMVASAYGDKSANPSEANNLSYGMGMRDGDGGTNPAFFNRYAQKHSFGMQEGPVSKRLVNNNLSHGKPVVLMGKGGAFGSNTHYLVANKASGSNINYIDPVNGASKTRNANDVLGHTKNTIYSFGKGPDESNMTEGVGAGETADSEDRNTYHRILNRVKNVNERKTNNGKGPGFDWGTGTNQLNISGPIDVYKMYRWPSGEYGSYHYDRGYEIHQGEDIHLTKGNKILAFTDGVVIAARHPCKNNDGYKGHKIPRGNIVVIKDGKGFYQWYQHVNSIYVKDGQRVKCGQPIAEYGNTGSSTGKHVHLEINKPSNGAVGYNGERIKAGTYRNNVKPSDYIRRYGDSDAYTGSYDVGESSDGDSSGNTTEAWSLMNNVIDRSNAASGEKFDYLSNIATVFNNVGTKYDSVLNAMITGTIPEANDPSSDGDSSGGTSTTNGATLTGDSNAQKIYSFLKGKGLSNNAIAGMLGVWKAESGLNPKNLEDKFEKYYGNNEQYTNKIDSTHKLPELGSRHKVGYGLAQWTYEPNSGSNQRKIKLVDYAKRSGKSVGDLGLQLDYAWDELTNGSYPKVKKSVFNANSPEDAALGMLTGYEMPAWSESKGRSYAHWPIRRDNARSFYNDIVNNYNKDGNGKGPGFSDIFNNAVNKTINSDFTQNIATKYDDYGKGPGYSQTNANILSDLINKINTAMQKATTESKTDSTVSSIADAITRTTKSKSNVSDKLLETISNTLGTMVELLASIKDNTNTTNKQTTTNINKSTRKRLPKVYANDYVPDNDNDVGMTIIDKLTLK